MPTEQKRLLEYIRELNEIFVKHGNLPLIYSSDEEWNSFTPLYMQPCLWKYTGDWQYWDFEDDEKEPNCLCIN